MPYAYRNYLRKRAQRIAQKFPLLKQCELCPEDDKQTSTARHHLDYRYEEIFISLCGDCHRLQKYR